MFIDDIIYVTLLLISIGFGPIFRSVKDPNAKRWVSTFVGILISTIVSGWHIAHPLLITTINAAIISRSPRRIRHTASFFFSFFYLLILFRFTNWYGVPTPPTHTNLILMIMTLRYGGLGYEINSLEEELKKDSSIKYYKPITNIGFFDIIHYGFSYMGVLTGPFYRYRTYWDCMNRNLGNHIDCWNATLHKMKIILVLLTLYLLTAHYFPVSYSVSDEFLQQSFFYRAWYVFPGTMVLRTRIYAGMLLSECACQMSGMGVYPSSTEPRSGLGPKNYKKYMEIMSDAKKLNNEQMNFDTIRNIDIWKVEGSTVQMSARNWNTTVQYWLANYVYRIFPYKALRAHAVFILSSLWHGYALGYYTSLFSVVFYFPVESIYIQFYNNSREGIIGKSGWWIFIFCARHICFSYLAFGMLLLSYDNIFTYYNSVYWYGHIAGAFLYVIGQILKPYLMPKILNKD